MKEALEFPEEGLIIEGSLLSQVAEDDESILRMSNDGGVLLLSIKAASGYGSIEDGFGVPSSVRRGPNYMNTLQMFLKLIRG